MKYKFTGESFNQGKYGTVYRIEAIKNFADVKIGDKGGFILSESNLSQDGDCWVYHDAYVYGNAKVCGNAKIRGTTRVHDNAEISGNVDLNGRIAVHDSPSITGNVIVTGETIIEGKATIFDNVKIRNSRIGDGVQIYDNVRIKDVVLMEETLFRGNARISGGYIGGNAIVEDNAIIQSSYMGMSPTVRGNARICGNSIIDGDAEVEGNAVIKDITLVNGYIDGDETMSDLMTAMYGGCEFDGYRILTITKKDMEIATGRTKFEQLEVVNGNFKLRLLYEDEMLDGFFNVQFKLENILGIKGNETEVSQIEIVSYEHSLDEVKEMIK